MSAAKIAITMERDILTKIDRLVREHVFPNRSQAIQKAVAEKLTRLDKTALARECAKLSRTEERALADEGLSADGAEWPTY
jgi:metal-responsive CopG/Arc/MetJ family transcriptional regulator